MLQILTKTLLAKTMLLLSATLVLTACQSGKPIKDKSVEYKNARSIPSLQVPAPSEQKKK